MTVARTTEIVESSSKSFDEAVRKGIKRATLSLDNVRGAWVKDQKIVCDDEGNIAQYRVRLKVTFVLSN